MTSQTFTIKERNAEKNSMVARKVAMLLESHASQTKEARYHATMAKRIETQICELLTGMKKGKVARLEMRKQTNGEPRIYVRTILIDEMRFGNGGQDVYLCGRCVRKDGTLGVRGEFEVSEWSVTDVTEEYPELK